MSSREAMIDAVTLRQILLERYSKGEARRLYKHIRRLDVLLEKKILAKYGKERAVILGREVEKISQELLTLYGSDLLKSLESFAVKEATFAENLLLAATAAKAVEPTSKKTLSKAIKMRPMELLLDGKLERVTVTQATKRFSASQSKRLGQIIKDGTTTGKTRQQVVKEVSALVTTRTKNQAEALVRTLTNHMSSVSMEEAFAGNEAITDGWQWVSTLDSRTSITCAGLDLKKFKPKDKQSKPPIHYGCRSKWIGVVKPEYDLGSDAEGTRAAKQYNDKFEPASAKLTYSGWLKRQDSRIQNEVLGATRAKLFRSGKISLGRFTDKTGKVLTLKQLEARNSMSFK
tara:strand:- start:716 stop:1750 length:1035 start_codon:yes stop_codon:yes gene_type:complete